jgi:putative membrane protein
MQQLMQLSGDGFDAAYMSDAGINSHLESIGLYQRQAALGQDPDLRAFAGRTLPRIQGHFGMASAMTGYSVAQGNNAAPGRRMRPHNATPGMSGGQMRQNNITPGVSGGQMRQ